LTPNVTTLFSIINLDHFGFPENEPGLASQYFINLSITRTTASAKPVRWRGRGHGRLSNDLLNKSLIVQDRRITILHFGISLPTPAGNGQLLLLHASHTRKLLYDRDRASRRIAVRTGQMSVI
jgi:hypothetical protein